MCRPPPGIQQKDGSVVVSTALRPFMDGRVIENPEKP
jgi:hypothetical protein